MYTYTTENNTENIERPNEERNQVEEKDNKPTSSKLENKQTICHEIEKDEDRNIKNYELIERGSYVTK